MHKHLPIIVTILCALPLYVLLLSMFAYFGKVCAIRWLFGDSSKEEKGGH